MITSADVSVLSRPDNWPVPSEEATQAVTGLLAKSVGIHRGELVGELARELAVRIYVRLGI